VDRQLIAQIWEAGIKPSQVYEFMKRKLRSQHVIEVDRQLIAQIWEAGIKSSQVYEFMK
jgi:hypothetical protein